MQAQVFYNLPYMSSGTLSKFRDFLSKTKFEFHFIAHGIKQNNYVFKTLLGSNAYLVPPVYKKCIYLNHLLYNHIIKTYYKNILNSLYAISSNVLPIYLLYKSELVRFDGTVDFSTKDLCIYTAQITMLLSTLVTNIITSIEFAKINICTILYILYVPYIRCILYSIHHFLK